MTNLTGKRYRSLIADSENDEEYGEVTHPIGTTFTVGEPLHLEGGVQTYAVLWDAAIVTATGAPVPPEGCKGMWTIWLADELANQAEVNDAGE